MRDWVNNWEEEWARFLSDTEARSAVGSRLALESVRRIHKEKKD